jgi:hypothetical protein
MYTRADGMQRWNSSRVFGKYSRRLFARATAPATQIVAEFQQSLADRPLNRYNSQSGKQRRKGISWNFILCSLSSVFRFSNALFAKLAQNTTILTAGRSRCTIFLIPIKDCSLSLLGVMNGIPDFPKKYSGPFQRGFHRFNAPSRALAFAPIAYLPTMY